MLEYSRPSVLITSTLHAVGYFTVIRCSDQLISALLVNSSIDGQTVCQCFPPLVPCPPLKDSPSTHSAAGQPTHAFSKLNSTSPLHSTGRPVGTCDDTTHEE